VRSSVISFSAETVGGITPPAQPESSPFTVAVEADSDHESALEDAQGAGQSARQDRDGLSGRLLSEDDAMEQARDAMLHAMRVRVREIMDVQDQYDVLCEHLAAEATLHLLSSGNALYRPSGSPTTPPVSRETSAAPYSPTRAGGSASRRRGHTQFSTFASPELSSSLAEEAERRDAEHSKHALAADIARMRLLREVKDVDSSREGSRSGSPSNPRKHAASDGANASAAHRQPRASM